MTTHLSAHGTPQNAIIECIKLQRSFHVNDTQVPVLQEINLTIKATEMFAIVGASGSGKTTLLQLLGGLDTPTAGEVIIDGLNPSQINDKELSQMRNKKLGFVYQFHHLIPEISALENISMPLFIAGIERHEALERGKKMLQEVGLSKRENHKPAKLSGGERQRVAIGRAMINKPLCLLADEPTGNLDQANAEHIIELLIELNHTYGMSVLLNTHDRKLAQKMHHIFSLQNGYLQAVM